MKKIGLVLFSIVTLFACKNEQQNEQQSATTSHQTNTDTTAIALTLCDCLDSLPENLEWCKLNFTDTVYARQKFECTGDSVYLDSIPQETKDSIRTDYENDLSLEIKEIEEEKEDPISEDCKQFLEDYAEAIKDFKSLTDKIEKNPDDIGLKISYASESEEMNSWGSKPQMFQCSQSESFKTQVEILNVKKDKLIEN
ncbi:MAG: hypothetical protein N4A35_11255 [Flavobacteriales bacterium]|jgi:hypothetical protein|nr:hypothetical protein [Flavobacteriales bacterium]